VQAVIIERVNATVAINVSVNQNRLIRYIAKWYSYSTLIGERSIAISMSVCLSVCLSANISLETLDRSSQDFLCRSAVAWYWRRCDT